MPSKKVDLYREHKSEYVASKKPVLLTVKPATYLAVDGQGAPGGKDFQTKIAALYAVAYTVKMTRLFDGKQDYGVCKLEGQFWSGKGKDLSKVSPRHWRWKLMIRTPAFIQKKELSEAAARLIEKGRESVVRNVRLEKIKEGRCVQMLHVGPYEREPETVEVMRGFVKTKGLSFRGRQHEIYISDPRRVDPDKLKTILRMPVRK
ncbi:MAG: GyrI-like domain-containing protein [Planctomycetota bacterium]|jgi:hypothetical protein